MIRSIPEKDWKFLRSIEAELLSALCGKVNQGAVEIVNLKNGTEHDKYLKLFKYIEASDRIVADCFNDWRRSNLLLKLPLLRRHKLLTDEHIAKLSDETRELLDRFAENW